MTAESLTTSFNIIDYIFIGMILVYGLIGFLSGLLTQILGWVELVAVALTGYLFYKVNGNLLILPLVVIAAAVLFMIIARVVKSLYFSPSDEGRKISSYSRTLGAVAGGLRGVLVGGFYLVSVYMLSVMLLNNSAFTNNFIKHSFFCSLIHDHDLIGSLNIVEALAKNKDIFTTDKNNNIMVNKNIIEKLQNNPSFKALLEDKDIINSIKTKNYNKLLFNPKFIKLISDKEFVRQMKSVISEGSKEQ